MSAFDEVRYRLRMPLDGWAATRYAVSDYLTRDQPLGHGLMDLATDPKLYYWRGPWWLKPITDVLDAADLVTGHQFCSANMEAQDRLLARHATRVDIPIAPVEVRHWREFVSGPSHEVEEHGPYMPPQRGLDDWYQILGPHWFCTGCGIIVGRRRPGGHGVCLDCGTTMLPRGGSADDELGDALTELSEFEFAAEPSPDTYYCKTHDRHLPCRRCLAEKREGATT